MSKVLCPRILAPILHCLLFTTAFIVHWIRVSGQPTDELWKADHRLQAVLWLADLPFSIIAQLFSLGSSMIPSNRIGPVITTVLWGVSGTIWWYFLGLSVEAWISRLSGRRG
jgi:hypothetical protein